MIWKQTKLVWRYNFITALDVANSNVNSTSWNKSGTDVFLANIGDNVGIGANSPTVKLEVQGDMKVNKTYGHTDTDARIMFGTGGQVEIRVVLP